MNNLNDNNKQKNNRLITLLTVSTAYHHHFRRDLKIFQRIYDIILFFPRFLRVLLVLCMRALSFTLLINTVLVALFVLKMIRLITFTFSSYRD